MPTPPANVLSSFEKQLLAPATNERPKESQNRTPKADKGKEPAPSTSKEENKGDNGRKASDNTNGGKRSALSDKPVVTEGEVPSNVGFDPMVMTTILTEALQNSLSGLRQDMESGFNDLGNLLTASYGEEDASIQFFSSQFYSHLFEIQYIFMVRK